MYEHNSLIIVGFLFFFILVTYEIFFRLGRKYQKEADEEVKTQNRTIHAGVLGLLALLLGFTFNMSLQRYDDRSHEVIKEANVIGTCMLRAKLLPAPYNSEAHRLLKNYLNLRIETSSIDLTDTEDRKLITQKTDKIQNQIWDLATEVAEIDPSPVRTGNFIISLNEVIDARGERNSVLQRHVPEVILFLLFIVFIIGGALMGYISGLSLKRAYISTVMFTFLIVLVVFIIIDLDRPKRGLIKINQDSLLELQAKD